jgi:hypothetical protein
MKKCIKTTTVLTYVLIFLGFAQIALGDAIQYYKCTFFPSSGPGPCDDKDAASCTYDNCVYYIADSSYRVCKYTGNAWDSCTPVNFPNPPTPPYHGPVNFNLYDEDCQWSGDFYGGSCGCPVPAQGTPPSEQYTLYTGC